MLSGCLSMSDGHCVRFLLCDVGLCADAVSSASVLTVIIGGGVDKSLA